MTSILLVDDNDLQRKMIRAHLELAGYAVTTASNGREALELARLAPPDLIVSDVVMDELDGFGLCRRIREDHSLQYVPVVLLSAHYAGTSDRELARSVGASELIERSPDFSKELTWIAGAVLAQGTGRTPFAVQRTTEVYEQQLDASAKLTTKLLAQTRHSEQRMQILLDNANDTIAVWSLDGIILEANHRCETVLGIPVSELIGRSMTELSQESREALPIVLETGNHRWVSNRRHALTGERVHLEIDAKVVELDGRAVIIAIGRDIAERVVATERAAAVEAMYRSLIEQMPDAVWRLGTNLDPEYLSPNTEQLFGIPVAKLAESRAEWMSRVHSDDLPALLHALTSCHREMKPTEVEYRFHHPDGKWVNILSRMAPREEHGRRYVDGLSSNITARKKLEQSLFASQKMEAIGVLTGGIAHDFNNLLSVIITNSELMLEQQPDHEDLVGIRDAAERAAALTRQLLAFSRRQILELQPISVDQVVSGIGHMLERMIGEDIKLTINRGKQLDSVRADVGQLEQIVMNLVVNARDAMPSGGTITLTTSTDHVSHLDSIADTVPPGRYVVLEVTDTGCGMTAETKAHLFEPFFTTKEPGRGTGLGLSTVYGIVKQFGGYIAVHSEVDQGTVFRVFLPCVGDRPPRPPERRERAAGGSETVLLVEDDPQVRRATERLLTLRGYHVLSASCGAEAIAFAKSHAIQLVISDVVMPEMSGPEVVARIRELLPSVRVLLMSGYTEHPQLEIGEIVGGPGFIQKPFAPVALATRVRELLDAEAPCEK